MDQIKIEALKAAQKEKVYYDGKKGIMVIPKTEDEIIDSARKIEGYLREGDVEPVLCKLANHPTRKCVNKFSK